MFIESREKPSKCHLALIGFNSVLGCFTCGFVQAGDADMVDIWAVKLDWGNDKDFYDTLITSGAVFGLTFGFVGAKIFTELGRRRAILLSNLVILVMTIPYFFVCNFWVFLFTRFFMGVAAGVTIIACSLYMSETVPSEWQSVVGTSINLGIVTGILIVYAFGLFLPGEDDPR